MSSFVLPEEVLELQQAAARFAAAELVPATRDHERAGRWPERVLTVLREFSLSSLDLPARLGGDDAGCLAKVSLLETLAAGDAAGLPAADQPGPAVGALAACPDPEVAAEVAAACLAGEASVALVVADEPARPLRVEWTPAWPSLRWVMASAGERLELIEVAPGGGAGVRALAFEASGGQSAELASGRLLGGWELSPGAGLALRGRARLWAAAVAVGVAQAAFDATVAYTTERVVFGKPVAYHQANAFDLAALATHLHGARLAVRDAAGAYDQGDPTAGFWATQAWVAAIDAAVAVTDAGIQLLGGHGFLVDHLAEKRFREAKMLALLWGGRDQADADLAAAVLEIPDPLFDGRLGVGGSER